MIETKEISQLLEEEIIAGLLSDRTFFTAVIHYLEPKYFEDQGNQLLLKGIKDVYLNYTKIPTIKELLLTFKDASKDEKKLVGAAVKTVNQVKLSHQLNEEMLIELTEKFIKAAIFAESVIMGAEALGTHNHDKMNESFKIAQEAVKVTLTSDLGIRLDEIDKRFDEYLPQNGLKLNIPSFDDVIGDGYTPSTLHLIISPSGVGKSALLSTFAVQFLKQGRDVVLLSLEMSEAQFYKRIDANLFDVDIYDLGTIDKQVLKNKYHQIKDGLGRLVVKEFPAGSLSPLGVDSFLDKLKTEEGIDNPIVMVDYLTLMKSDLLKASDNSYGYFKGVAEELRAVAQKRKIVIFTPMQSNRSSVNNLEADQSTLSDSMAVYMTADSAFLLLQTPEMKEKGEMKVNFVKNRMSRKTYSFNIGYDYRRFRIDDRFYMNGSNVSTQTNPVTGLNAGNDLSGLMNL